MGPTVCVSQADLRYVPRFFHYIEQHHANDLETFQGDGSGYWEDGIGSDAFFEREDRENQNRALSAEILSTTTHSLDPNLNRPNGYSPTSGKTSFYSQNTPGRPTTPFRNPIATKL
jgi:hypothetical protein